MMNWEWSATLLCCLFCTSVMPHLLLFMHMCFQGDTVICAERNPLPKHSSDDGKWLNINYNITMKMLCISDSHADEAAQVRWQTPFCKNDPDKYSTFIWGSGWKFFGNNRHFDSRGSGRYHCHRDCWKSIGRCLKIILAQISLIR